MFKVNIDNHRRLDIEGETFLIDPRIAEVIEQIERERDEARRWAAAWKRAAKEQWHLAKTRAVILEKKVTAVEKKIYPLVDERDEALRLLRAALAQNRTWDSHEAREAQRLVEEYDNE